MVNERPSKKSKIEKVGKLIENSLSAGELGIDLGSTMMGGEKAFATSLGGLGLGQESIELVFATIKAGAKLPLSKAVGVIWYVCCFEENPGGPTEDPPPSGGEAGGAAV